MIGRQIAHYRVTAELGSGGMGTVYRAEDTRLGRAVALKFPHRHLVQDGDARARLLREARIASVLDHPNIVVLYDVGEVEGEVFLAMQCVEGRSLRERLASGPLPVQEALGVGRAVADALAHAHARGVVHRDIKPENVLLTGDGRVKVADFGIALGPAAGTQSVTTAIAGTPAYLAPEILEGQPASPRSDLYSLGAVLHELLAGAPAYSGETIVELLYRIAHQEPSALPSALPEDVRRLVRRLLARNPSDRPADAVAVADALLAAGSAATTIGATRPTPENAGAGAPGRTLAVLPFENLTGNAEDDYLCAGITEDLLTDILKIPDLQTASRSLVGSRRSGSSDVREVGRDLGVATVLEGGVRRSGDRVRVNARLARTDNGYQLWAERYDRRLEDIFDMQEDISRRIAEALRVVFEPESEDARLGRRTSSPIAYDLRLRAMALYRLYEESEMRRAIELLQSALREDPAYALARAELAECLTQLICKSWDSDRSLLDRAEEEAGRALAIAPRLPEGFRTRGHIWMHRRQPARALGDYHRATEMDPRFMAPINSLAVAYIVMGDESRGEIFARRAHEADPYHFAPYANLAQLLCFAGRLEESREWAREAMTVPMSRHGRLQILETLTLCNLADRNATGISDLLAEIEHYAPDPQAVSLLALAHAVLGRLDDARARLADPALAASPNPAAHVNVARAWTLMGDRARALSALGRSFELDIVDVGLSRHDPLLHDLLEDSRFDELRSFSRETRP